MKILLAVNTSTCSGAAVREMARRRWPTGSEMRVISVAEMPVMLAVGSGWAAPELASPGLADRVERIILENARNAVLLALLEIEEGNNSELRTTGEISKGSPARCILDEAERWGADLIVVGSCGGSTLHNLFRGNTAMAVAKHAKCSVEIVKFLRASEEQLGLDGPVQKEVLNAISYSN